MRHLGIDYGSKRVGIALSDEKAFFAFPEAVLQNDNTLFAKVRDLVTKNNITTVVLGASYGYSGEENPIMRDILRFKKKLEDEMGTEVFLQSETLSSAAARRGRAAAEDPRSRKSASRKPVDASAAAIILQSFLDSRVSSR